MLFQIANLQYLVFIFHRQPLLLSCDETNCCKLCIKAPKEDKKYWKWVWNMLLLKRLTWMMQQLFYQNWMAFSHEKNKDDTEVFSQWQPVVAFLSTLSGKSLVKHHSDTTRYAVVKHSGIVPASIERCRMLLPGWNGNKKIQPGSVWVTVTSNK